MSHFFPWFIKFCVPFSGFIFGFQQQKESLDDASQSERLLIALFCAPGYTTPNAKEG
ncbi:conserved protein of unknown function [Enterobacter cancerogenus]|nr:hypothetical protein ENTCAN_08223 [Enterobacter cancerogenus ATCC 35316]CAD5351295.1 conserved protein of unknown function [Enterobacter cancerogenus]